LQFSDCFAATSMSASTRRLAPSINSSREAGVWLTPLGTSAPVTSNTAEGASSGAKASSASRTAFNLGRRVLPTAAMNLVMRLLPERAQILNAQRDEIHRKNSLAKAS